LVVVSIIEFVIYALLGLSLLSFFLNIIIMVLSYFISTKLSIFTKLEKEFLENLGLKNKLKLIGL
jgi:ABC-type enterochelin transport system permease subunit